MRAANFASSGGWIPAILHFWTEGESMPTYEFVCLQCGEQFVRVMSISEHEAYKPVCPKCGGEAKQQMSEFIAKTSRKS